MRINTASDAGNDGGGIHDGQLLQRRQVVQVGDFGEILQLIFRQGQNSDALGKSFGGEAQGRDHVSVKQNRRQQLHVTKICSFERAA